MRTFDFAPLYRSTVGFDRLFDMLDNSVRPDWPPYDIEKLGDDEYRISMAIAGFGVDEIEMTQQGTDLLVIGQKKATEDDRQLLHRGIAQRNFKQTFSLADHVKVAAADFENGLLSIELVREVPEEMKPRRIQLGAGKPPRCRTISASRSNRTPRWPEDQRMRRAGHNQPGARRSHAASHREEIAMKHFAFGAAALALLAAISPVAAADHNRGWADLLGGRPVAARRLVAADWDYLPELRSFAHHPGRTAAATPTGTATIPPKHASVVSGVLGDDA